MYDQCQGGDWKRACWQSEMCSAYYQASPATRKAAAPWRFPLSGFQIHTSELLKGMLSRNQTATSPLDYTSAKKYTYLKTEQPTPNHSGIANTQFRARQRRRQSSHRTFLINLLCLCSVKTQPPPFSTGLERKPDGMHSENEKKSGWFLCKPPSSPQPQTHTQHTAHSILLCTFLVISHRTDAEPRQVMDLCAKTPTFRKHEKGLILVFKDHVVLILSNFPADSPGIPSAL